MFALRSIPFRMTSVLLSACGIIILSPAPLSAQVQPDGPISFDIPTQPLDGALAQYFHITGVQLLYDSALTAGYRSAVVKGTYAPREALRLLLRGTDLVVRYSRANAAIIVRNDVVMDTPLVPLGRVVVRERIVTHISPADRITYYQQLEDALQNRLRADKRTGHLSFSATMLLAVDQDGRIRNLVIKKGSHDQKIDRALLGILRDAMVPPPPSGLEQPLTIALKGTRP